MAGLCAFLCPGLGHLILGKPFQALFWMVIIVVGYMAAVFPGILLHVLSIIFAARAGRRDQIKTMETAIRRAQRR